MRKHAAQGQSIPKQHPETKAWPQRHKDTKKEIMFNVQPTINISTPKKRSQASCDIRALSID
jgi:hypothetical protein